MMSGIGLCERLGGFGRDELLLIRGRDEPARPSFDLDVSSPQPRMSRSSSLPVVEHFHLLGDRLQFPVAPTGAGHLI
jgi:hypothetical protein